MKNRLAKLALVAGSFALCALSSCGKDDEKHVYTLSENGCSTGEQTYDSKEALCAGLKSESRNNHCAYGLRKQKFLSECPGAWSIEQ